VPCLIVACLALSIVVLHSILLSVVAVAFPDSFSTSCGRTLFTYLVLLGSVRTGTRPQADEDPQGPADLATADLLHTKTFISNSFFV